MKKSSGFIIGLIVLGIIALIGWQNNQQQKYYPLGASPLGDTTTPSTAKTFTAAEVAAHNSPQSCYAIVNGNVYDLTAWISRHPGGPEAISGLCGTDGTTAFRNQHGDSPEPNQMLVSFLIGKIAN